jgi:hypothetical protein
MRRFGGGAVGTDQLEHLATQPGELREGFGAYLVARYAEIDVDPRTNSNK